MLVLKLKYLQFCVELLPLYSPWRCYKRRRGRNGGENKGQITKK
jgi:hypothetical protein